MTTFNPQKAVDRAKLTLMTQPSTTFWSALLSNLHLHIDTSQPTAATDGVNLWVNPKFIEPLSTPQLIGLLLHEVKHVVYEHPIRFKEMKNVDNQKRWNIAGDYLINYEILKDGYELPDGGLHDTKYAGWSTLQIYNDIDPDDYPDFKMDILEAPDGMDPSEHKEQVISNIVKAVTQAKLSNDFGSIPGDLLRRLKDILDPKLPWQQILQNYMNSYAKEEYSWSRPNRRYCPEFYLPSMRSDALEQITVAIDVSGSISQQDMDAFMAEIVYIWDILKPKKLRMIGFDTRIHDDLEFVEGDSLDPPGLTGGGGTNVRPILQTVLQDLPEITIIFTDGYFDVPSILDQVSSDLFWVIKNNNSEFTLPKGTVIHYE
jgi:predicted metal-dependent peptidase